MAANEYWLSAFYSHQGQEVPDQPDNSWDPQFGEWDGGGWGSFPGFPGFNWGGIGGGWWGDGFIGPNLLPNPYAVPGTDLNAFGHFDFNYAYPGAYALDFEGYGYYDHYPAQSEGQEYVSPLGWQLFQQQPGGGMSRVLMADWFQSETLGLVGHTTSSLWLEMPNSWDDSWWNSGNSLYLKLVGVNPIHSDHWTDPPWVTVTPGRSYASTIFVSNYYPNPAEGSQNFHRAAMGVEWYSAPDLVNGIPPVKISESLGPEAPFTGWGQFQYSYQTSPFWAGRAAEPVGNFTAPAGAAYAVPFVQLWIDGWGHLITKFEFVEMM